MFNKVPFFVALSKLFSVHFQVIFKPTPLCEENSVLRFYQDFLVLQENQNLLWSQSMMGHHQYKCQHSLSRKDLLFPDMRTKCWIHIFLCFSQAVLCNIGNILEFHPHWQILQNLQRDNYNCHVCWLINLNKTTIFHFVAVICHTIYEMRWLIALSESVIFQFLVLHFAQAFYWLWFYKLAVLSFHRLCDFSFTVQSFLLLNNLLQEPFH